MARRGPRARPDRRSMRLWLTPGHILAGAIPSPSSAATRCPRRVGGALRPLPLVAVLGLILVAAIGSPRSASSSAGRPSSTLHDGLPDRPSTDSDRTSGPGQAAGRRRVDLIDDIQAAPSSRSPTSRTMVTPGPVRRPKAPRSSATSASPTWRAIRMRSMRPGSAARATPPRLTIAPDGRR